MISNSALREILENWNPWWNSGQVPSHLTGFPRRVTEKLKRLAEKWDMAKAIIGPRRAGKTTVMYQLIDWLIKKKTDTKNILYLNLEDPGLTETSLDRIYNEFIKMNKPKETYIFLDEVQNKAKWERWVRTKIDQTGKDNIFLSGSTSKLISPSVSHALAGRVFIEKVYPFSFAEILEINKVRPHGSKGKNLALGLLEDCLRYGCYPRIVLEKDEMEKRTYLVSYFETIISRDLAAAHGLDQSKTNEILRYILKNSGDLTSVNKIKNIFHISYETAEKYINAMKDAMIVLESRRFSFSIKEQLAFPRKLYPIDLGLRLVSYPITTKDTGKLLETFIAEELVKSGYQTFYQSNGGECDIIVVDQGTPIYAIQVTTELIHSNKERELKGLELASRELGIKGKILELEDTPRFLYLLGNGEKVFK